MLLGRIQVLSDTYIQRRQMGALRGVAIFTDSFKRAVLKGNKGAEDKALSSAQNLKQTLLKS